MFLGHVVCLRGDIRWHPRSPNLTSCDFFFLGLPQSSGIPTSSPNFGRC
jgi:hypothetical protein